MTTLIIHGSPRANGCSSTIARNIANKFKSDEILEINLHKEKLPYCVGCLNCVKKGVEYCPHSDITIPLKEKMLKADLIIVASPVYILHMSGQLKTFFDHYPTMFLIHRPEKTMFNKQVIVVATAAGPVCKKTLKEIKETFTFFGVTKTHTIGVPVQAENYESINPKILEDVDKKTNKIVKKVNKNFNKKKVSLKIRIWFRISKLMQIKFSVSEVDYAYWQNNNWLKRGRPWK